MYLTQLVKGGQMLGTADVKAISYNAKTINENITIDSNVNALSAGPIAIANGNSVVLNDGASWVIV